MAFDAQIIHWKTIGEFAAYLKLVPRSLWCKGVTNHNSYVPDELTWHGMVTMHSMLEYYRDTLKWESGPHLFLAAAAPNAKDKGIFQMTSITRPGTHAGACNAHSLGLESVGNFNERPPTADQYTLLIAVNRLILEHWGLSPDKVSVHNECMPGRTCPGKYLTGTQIRKDLRAPWPRPTPTPPPVTPPGVQPFRLTVPCAPLTARSPSAPLASGVVFAAGDVVNVGMEGSKDGWLWVSDGPDTAPGIGWIPSSYARPA